MSDTLAAFLIGLVITVPLIVLTLFYVQVLPWRTGGDKPGDEAELVPHGHALRPALVLIECLECEAEIEIWVPVLVLMAETGERSGEITFEVDHEALSVQPLWDHQLFAHGPGGQQ